MMGTVNWLHLARNELAMERGKMFAPKRGKLHSLNISVTVINVVFAPPAAASRPTNILLIYCLA